MSFSWKSKVGVYYALVFIAHNKDIHNLLLTNVIYYYK